MNIRPPAAEPATRPEGAGPLKDAQPNVPVEKPGTPTSTKDGVQRGEDPTAQAVFGPSDANKTVQDPKNTPGGVGVADVQREAVAGNPASDARFAALPPGVREGIQSAVANGPAFLREIFKRLVNSPAFLKLPAEVQEKVVALLAKSADKKHGELIEKLVRSDAFSKLPEKEQMKLLDRLTSGKGEAEIPQQQARDDGGGKNIRIPAGGDAVAVSTLIDIALWFDPGPPTLEGGPFVERDGHGGAQADEGDATATYAEIKQKLHDLRAASDLSRAGVEAMLAVDLAAIPGAADGILRAEPRRGLFERVTFTSDAGAVSLLLELRAGVDVPYHACRNDLFGVELAPPPGAEAAAGGDLAFSLTDEAIGQRIDLTFERKSARLLSVALTRAPSG